MLRDGEGKIHRKLGAGGECGRIVLAVVAYKEFLLSDGELGSIPCFNPLHNFIDTSSCIIKEFRSREARGRA